MRKQLKKMSAWVMVLIIAFQIIPMKVYAAPSPSEEVVCTFTNEDLLYAAEKAYENGDLTDEQMNTVWRTLSTRLGVKGENKIVVVSYNSTSYLYDYYLNNVTWSLVVSLGSGAAGVLLSMIPGITAGAAAIIGAAVGGVGGTMLSAENGVIIRIRMVDISLGIGDPQYVYEFVSIREQ